MDESVPEADSLISHLRTSFTAEGAQAFGHLVLYTSFGVVRGRIGIALAQELTGQAAQDASSRGSNEAIELHGVSVEHYSNHLPTASFDRLFVRLADIRGYALELLQGQG